MDVSWGRDGIVVTIARACIAHPRQALVLDVDLTHLNPTLDRFLPYTGPDMFILPLPITFSTSRGLLSGHQTISVFSTATITSSQTAKIGPVGQHHESPPKAGLLPPALPTGRRRLAWSPKKMMEVRRDK